MLKMSVLLLCVTILLKSGSGNTGDNYHQNSYGIKHGNSYQ